jgi:hypothetical protein
MAEQPDRLFRSMIATGEAASPALDLEDPIQGRYQLNCPRRDRPQCGKDFERWAGHEAKSK